LDICKSFIQTCFIIYLIKVNTLIADPPPGRRWNVQTRADPGNHAFTYNNVAEMGQAQASAGADSRFQSNRNNQQINKPAFDFQQNQQRDNFQPQPAPIYQQSIQDVIRQVHQNYHID
jgi:hypothetical protein